MQEVILVDSRDRVIGTMEKLEAHRKGLLHRAFSVLLYNSKGEILLQKRMKEKYHSGGLWSNTCCSHPFPDEPIEAAAKRRLMEELGIDTQPEFQYKFIYKTALDKNLIEHELDHVFTGTFDGTPEINPEEVESYKFMSLEQLKADMALHPDEYTPWFHIIIESLLGINPNTP